VQRAMEAHDIYTLSQWRREKEVRREAMKRRR
jgi:hypothetical protein